MILGGLIILVLAIFVVKYFKNQTTNQILPSGSSQTRQTHTVAKGDNLWKIAVKYYNDGFKWGDIAKANNVTNPDQIEVGQELSIPEVASITTTKPTPVTTNTVAQTQIDNNSSITAATYEVVKGDSLWKIAVRAYQDGYKWPTLAKENKLKNPNLIYPGNIIIIPR